MTPSQSVTQLNSFAMANGIVMKECSPRDGIEQMFSFYQCVGADSCNEANADMLLFQWGTYDWGQGNHFELNITRQFIEKELDDDSAISQLSLTFKFEPNAETESLGDANRWCSSRAELSAFRAFVISSK